MQVTLQILTALIEKTPKDLPLFASCVLQILEQILQSRDITMVESSIPTFEAFCAHHDPTSLMGDQAYLNQYLAVVRQYASLASTRAFAGRLEPSKPIALRWRNTGLKAIRSIARSEALSSVATEQYDVAVPMILENLWTDNEDFLDVLHQRAEAEEEKLAGALLRRRTSVATVQTADTDPAAAAAAASAAAAAAAAAAATDDADPIALADTAVDMDKLAEEDTGVLAMECLRQIFTAPNRSQVHAATAALLKFVQERVSQEEEVVRTDHNGRDSGWAIKVFLLAARWAPVADRFTILVTAMDTLAQLPLTDDTLRQHIVLAAIIGALLRSDVNLIGLSVMDVLLQFMAHIRRLVQLPGDPDAMRADEPLPGQPDPRTPTSIQFTDRAERVAAERRDLLFRLQECIGDLATHVYYADQISDMISTILQKLKPSRSRSSSTPSGSSPHGGNGGDKSDVVATPKSSANALSDDQHVDSLFALTVAKIAALRAIKSVLLVANPRSKMSANPGLSRSRVPVQVWDGTQWLLRDPDGLVRKAYADAVVTWLDRETTSADCRARDETSRPTLKNRELPGATLAKRAVSSSAAAAAAAAARDKPAKVPRSHFLQLLHVAVYDNAIQYIDYETDIVLLHVLLAKLVDKLGVNAVRYGLPMIFRLQEDIQDAETPIQKVRLGSLVHGYFWVLTEKFDLDGSAVGRAIHNEIVRRRSKQFWVDGVNMPAPLIDLVATPGTPRPQPRLPLEEIESEALLPFDERHALVESVCAAYEAMASSPPTSPAASPGRNFSHPVLGSTMSTIPTIEAENEIPAHFREEMLSEWSRESALAAVQTVSKSASLNGSRSGGATTAVNAHEHGLRPDRSSPGGSRTNLRPSTSPTGNTASHSRTRKSSLRSGHSLAPAADAAGQHADGKEQVASVEQLKLVLSGQLQPPGMQGPGGGLEHDDPAGHSDSSDSLVSYDMAPSELSFNPAVGGGSGEPGTTTTTSIHGSPTQRPPSSRERKASLSSQGAGGPPGSHPALQEEEDGADAAAAEAGGGNGNDAGSMVPPVPPIPDGLVSAAGDEGGRGAATAAGRRPSTSKHGIGTNVGARARNRSASRTRTRSMSRGTVPAPAPAGGRERTLSTSWSSVHSSPGAAGAAGADGNGVAERMPAMDLQALLRGIDTQGEDEDLGGVVRPPY